MCLYVEIYIFYSTDNDVIERDKLLQEAHQYKISQVVWPVIKAAVCKSINLTIISSFLTCFIFSVT